MTQENNQILLDGDFVGHPFRGNGSVTADEHSKSAVHSSMRAKHAEKHGDDNAKKSAHRKAHHAHMAASVDAKGKAKTYHETMAKFHKSRSGDATLDSIEVGASGFIVEYRTKGQNGRVHPSQDFLVQSKNATDKKSAEAFALKRLGSNIEILSVKYADSSGVAMDAMHGDNPYSDGTGKWHSQTMAAFAKKTDDQLRFIIKDAGEAARLGEKINNPKVGEYMDEVHYAQMELRKRQDAANGRKKINVKFDDADAQPEGDSGEDGPTDSKDQLGMFDSATLDASVPDGYLIGVFRKDGEVVGRADIGGDGKAVIYVGGVGTERVKNEFDRPAVFTEDADSVTQYVKDLANWFHGKGDGTAVNQAPVLPEPVAQPEDLTTEVGIASAIQNRLAMNAYASGLKYRGSDAYYASEEAKRADIEKMKVRAVAEMGAPLSQIWMDMAAAIMNKDADELIAKFVYGSFETVEGVFKDVTGVAVKNLSQPKKIDALLTWAGKSADEIAAWKAAKVERANAIEAKRTEEGKLRDLKNAWADLEMKSFKVGEGSMTGGQYIKGRVEDGYKTVKTYRQGATVGYYLADETGAGSATGKVAIINKLLKAVRNFNGGNMAGALEALGMEFSSKVTAVESDEPGITEADNKAAEALFQTPAQREAASASSAGSDLTYTDDGMFASFIPVSKAGETAWNEMAKENGGTGKVLSIHAESTIAQLKAAGYKVEKAAPQAPLSAEDADKMLTELEAPKKLELSDALPAVKFLKSFIGDSQMQAIISGMRGEEGQYFIKRMIDLAAQIKAMPKTYGQDGLGMKSIVHLHYFHGSMDHYITEKDMESEQLQAFGWADLGYGAEAGYISIAELIQNNVEIDLHWTPKTIGEVLGKTDEPESDAQDQKATAVTLGDENAYSGAKIVSKEHPEWGEFTLNKDRNGWTRTSLSGSSMLDPGEFKFWNLVSPVKVAEVAMPEQVPAAKPAPQENPQRDADMAYLKSVIDNTVADILAAEVGDKLEAIINLYADDSEVTAQAELAADAYSKAMLATV